MSPVNEVEIVSRLVRLESEVSNVNGKLDDIIHFRLDEIKKSIVDLSGRVVTKNHLQVELMQHKDTCHNDKKTVLFNLPLETIIKIILLMFAAAGLGGSVVLELLNKF